MKKIGLILFSLILALQFVSAAGISIDSPVNNQIFTSSLIRVTTTATDADTCYINYLGSNESYNCASVDISLPRNSYECYSNCTGNRIIVYALNESSPAPFSSASIDVYVYRNDGFLPFLIGIIYMILCIAMVVYPVALLVMAFDANNKEDINGIHVGISAFIFVFALIFYILTKEFTKLPYISEPLSVVFIPFAIMDLAIPTALVIISQVKKWQL